MSTHRSCKLRPLVPAVAGLVFGIGLTGCAGGSGVHDAATLPPVSRSTTSGTAVSSPASPTVASPTPRRPLSERAAALQVVHRYYTVLNGLHRNMSAAPMAALFAAHCPCRAQVRAIRTAAARGEHFVDHASLNVLRASIQDSRHAFVLVNLDTARAGLSRADGSRVTSAPPQRGVQRVFRLVRVGNRWLIDRIEAG